MTMVLEARDVATKAKLFRGLADPSRLSILEVLREGPRRVSEIVEATGLSQPNTSNHLSCLYDCGLVEREPRGRSVYYRLADEGVEELLALADRLLAGVARGVETCRRYPAPGSEVAWRSGRRSESRPEVGREARR